MRVFIGLEDIAHIATEYGKGFRALGYETILMVKRRSHFYPSSEYDYVINKNFSGSKSNSYVAQGIRYAHQIVYSAIKSRKIIKSCDYFIFIGRNSLLTFNKDFPFIKRSGKKIISTFWGSDIRYTPALERDLTNMGVVEDFRPFLDFIKTLPLGYRKKTRAVQSAEKYADAILSQPGYSQLIKRPYMRANIPIDLSAIKHKIPARKNPLIIHAPSRRGIKGTKFILEIMNKLRNEGLHFDFKLIENLRNSELLDLLTNTDIVIDELFSDTVGRLSAEAMAAGCVTLTHYIEYFTKVPPNCPAIDITKDTLYGKIREMILDIDLRVQIAKAGRPYVEKHNDHVKIAKEIENLLTSSKITNYDFIP